MPHWLLLAIRNWRAKPGRSAGTLLAVALGVATVVWVTSSYESVRQTIDRQVVERWVGRSHISIESSLGHWGSIDQRLEEWVRRTDGVTHCTSRLRRRLSASAVVGNAEWAAGSDREPKKSIDVDAVGIQPTSEYSFRHYDVHGRLPSATDAQVAVMESATARRLGVKVGDFVALSFAPSLPPAHFKLIGELDARNVGEFQRPVILLPLKDLQAFTGDKDQVTIIDMMIRDASAEQIEKTADVLRTNLDGPAEGCQVTTSGSKLFLLREAQRHTEFALTVASCIALLTAFFVISTTMSMGITERVRQLGTMRCIGMTRAQVFGSVIAEVVPMGVVGLVLGIGLGFLLTSWIAWMAPGWVGPATMSRHGIWIAILGGAITTLAAASLPAIHATRVSPLSATRPLARRAGTLAVWICGGVGACMAGMHWWMVNSLDAIHWTSSSIVLLGIVLLYGGYGLMAPLWVRLLGAILVQVAARVLGLRPILLSEHGARSYWRGGGVCCGLMVGLSMLVGIVVHSESVRAGWDFPRRIAQAYVWSRTPVHASSAVTIRRLPFVAECTVVNDFLTDAGQKRSRFFDMFRLKTTFVAGEPDRFLTMTKLLFLEGNLEDATSKLRSGGHILLPQEAARTFGLRLGDTLPITAAGHTADFIVAGVVKSPALDVAVTYFQADSYMMIAAASSVLGTLDDAREVFGIDSITLFLMNFVPLEGEAPPLFQADSPPRVNDRLVAKELLNWGDRLPVDGDEWVLLQSRLLQWLSRRPAETDFGWALLRFRRSLDYVVARWADLTSAERWELFGDQLAIRTVVDVINRPAAVFGSLRELKQTIDRDIRQATYVLTLIPLVALGVAAIGVANLMVANVLSRVREIAILRSCGATRWLIARLVLGEAAVLGVIGSAIGLALGLQGAASMNLITLGLIGFAPPLTIPTVEVGAGVAVTVGVCILASLSPARYAARTNVIEALRAI